MEKAKYKFVETEGCTAFSFTINGKDLSEVSKAEQNEAIEYLCAKMKGEIDKGTILFPDIVKVFHETDYRRGKKSLASNASIQLVGQPGKFELIYNHEQNAEIPGLGQIKSSLY